MKSSIPQEVRSASATYRTGAEVGRGGHSVVTQAMHVTSGRFYAVKHVRLDDLDADDLGQQRRRVARRRRPALVETCDAG